MNGTNILFNNPEIEKIIQKEPFLWFNNHLESFSNNLGLALIFEEMNKAAKFMDDYTPQIAKLFPETQKTKGKIISPLYEISKFKNKYQPLKGKLLLKDDGELPVAGSIKARGGFFEILQFTHQLCIENQHIKANEIADFTNKDIIKLLSNYTIGVGSTGNLGLSIGIISAKLGFKVNVYMSHDAKAWKKDLLKKSGANVIEEDGDFSIAINKGRTETLALKNSYFVDDEKSKQLFLGYSLAAFELLNQFHSLGIKIDKEHPLFIYSPCGVGGSAGGVMWGLKNIFGDNAHSFFVEPTHSPSVLLGLITGKKEKICVQDVGLDNQTEADGLAVGRPSAFASNFIDKLVSGIYTVEDKSLNPLVKELFSIENIFIEPSATVGLLGPKMLEQSDYIKKNNINPSNIIHLVWATGGSLVPEYIRNNILISEIEKN